MRVEQVAGGRGGIRTHVRIAPKPDFESGAFNHSATLPLEDSPHAGVGCRQIYCAPTDDRASSFTRQSGGAGGKRRFSACTTGQTPYCSIRWQNNDLIL